MSATMPTTGEPQRSWLDRHLPAGLDRASALILLVGLATLYVPSFWEMSHTLWTTDEYGHGPIILTVSIWIAWRRREAFLALPARPATASGTAVFMFGLLLYLVGRSQLMPILEVLSQIFVMGGLTLLFRGWAGLRLMLFPILFMLFMVPLPGMAAAAITQPLKMAVSAVASTILYQFGYPIGRSGVILTVGQYQLLVADACAGLNSMFSLEALGLLYMNLMGYKSVGRNLIMALLVIPISFSANVVRVMILVLVTYYFGDAAGQGFVHGFAGMVLFMVALMLLVTTDRLTGLLGGKRFAT